MKKFLYLYVCVFLISCTSSSPETTKEIESAVDSLERAMLDGDYGDVGKQDKGNVQKNWEYSESKDEMTGKKTYYAESVSTNTLEFDFPYNGGSSFSLGIRYGKQGKDIFLRVSKGQFLTSYNGSSMRVKFDDESPVNYSYVGTSDGSADVIFIESYSKFLNKLKKAKKVSLEPEFYQAGKQIINFNVEGLKWEY